MPVNGKMPPTTSVDELALCIFIDDFTEPRAHGRDGRCGRDREREREADRCTPPSSFDFIAYFPLVA